MKYLSLSLILLLVLLFIPFEDSLRSSNSIEIYVTKPCVVWEAWKIGQSSGYGNTIMSSFITNSETTCGVEVEVSYCNSQPSSYVLPITKYDFVITMNNGFSVTKKYSKTTGPDASSLDPATTFSIDAKLEGPRDQENIACPLNGRENRSMEVTVTFTGYYGSDPNNQKTVTLTKTWKQDTVDILRQEYVDLTPSGKRAELPVPSKTSFEQTISSNGTDGWNTGHYSVMIDDGLKNKKAKWLAEVNKNREGKNDSKGNALSMFSDADFVVTSAYRNPYHQRFHVGGSFHSRHCYGDALDVSTLDVDGDGKIEQVIDNASKSDDGKLMEQAAEKAKAKWTGSYKYYDTHTHADWTSRGSGVWPPKDGTVYSTPYTLSDPSSSDGTGTTTQTETTEASISEEQSTSASEDAEDEATLSYSLVSSDGVYTATAGFGHEANFTTNEAYTLVYWYVKTPGDTSHYGANVVTEAGDGSKMTSQLDYSFPSGVSGDYQFLVYVYSSGGSVYETSYTVSVSLPSSNTPPTTPSPTPTVSLPVWSDIPDPYNLIVGNSFYLDLSSYVTGSPTFTWGGGYPPAGLRFSNGILSGTVTSVESRGVRVKATNSAGYAYSEWIQINVTAP